MRPATRATALLVAFFCSVVAVSGVLTIRRNTQDCIYPRIASNAERLWPTSAYLPRGNSIKQIQGGLIVDSTAGFTIEYYGTYKIITNKLVNEKYLLYHCGTTPPTTAGVSKVFEGPLSSVSVDDATAADYLTQLLLMDRVAYAGELAVSGCLQAMAGCGYVAAGDSATSALRANVDAFWTFGFGTSTDTMSISFNAPSAVKPLERTKWLAYAAAFFNKEYQANLVYNAIKDSYLGLRREALAQRGTPPLVCWVYKDWDGDYAMTFSKYKVEYVNDAGGQMYPWKSLTDAGMKPKPATSTTNLVFFSTVDNVAGKWAGVLSICDVIIDESYEMSTGGLTEMDAENPDGFLQAHDIKAYASQIPAVNEAQVYTLAATIGQTITNPNSPIRGSVGLDWFERGVSRCDEVLQDLVKVIRPAVPQPSWTGFKFLLRLDGKQQQKRVPAECKLATVKLNDCVRAGYAARICPNAVRDCNTGVMEFPALEQRCAAVSAQDKVRRQRKRQRPRVVECVKP